MLPRPLLRIVRLLPFLALLSAAAQDVSGASGYTVRGTILNSVTEGAVGRALITIDSDQAQLTAGDGSFSFERVPSGTHTLTIRKPGYMSFGGSGSMIAVRHFGGGSPSTELGPPRRILVGPDMPALTFRLTPEAAISGHITLSTADPADDIRVSLFRREFQNGHPRWTLADITKTRSDGSWRAAGLTPGRYMVFASAAFDGPPEPGNSQTPVWGFPALYYPGVTDVGSAGALIVKPGQQAQADMTLTRQRFSPVTIRVNSMPDTPTSFDIVDSAGRSAGLPIRFDRGSQTAHADVPNGSWTLIARAFGRTMQFGRADFQVAGAPVALTVSVAPLPSVPVLIRRDFSASTNGSQPPASIGPGMNLYLAPADDSAAGGDIRSLHRDHDRDSSNYEVLIFQPGHFWVQTSDFPPTYVASVTSGGTDLGSTPLTVLPDSPPAPIEVTLRNDPGTITGQLDSNAPAAENPGEQLQAWIYAIPLFPTTTRLPEGSLQNNGQFTIANLAPGSYRVIACETRQDIDFHSQEGLAALSGKGKVVSVEPSGTAQVELSILHGDLSE